MHVSRLLSQPDDDEPEALPPLEPVLEFWDNPSRDPSPLPVNDSFGTRLTGGADDYFIARGFYLGDMTGPIYMHYRGMHPVTHGGWGSRDRPRRPTWEAGPAPLVNLPRAWLRFSPRYHTRVEPGGSHQCWLFIRRLLLQVVAVCDVAFGPPPPPCAGADPELAAIEVRLAQFLTNDLASELPFETYHVKQQATVGRFIELLQRRRPLVPWTKATPHEVVAFLISKDATSRTIVHSTLTCPNMGSMSSPFGPCDCPLRAKATSLKTTAAMLRAEFSREVSPLKWAPQTFLGNPVHSALVERYIDLMEKAQTRAGVEISQAVMISVVEFMSLMTLLSSLANDASTPPFQRLLYFMDACAFSFQYAAGSRMGDLLSSLRASQVRISAVSVGFRQQWGKTLRGFGRRRDFDLPATREQLICPLRRFCEYVLAARSLGVDLTQRDLSDPSGSPLGFLFRQIDPISGLVASVPETYPRLQTRFRGYLEQLQLYRGQTLHGVRSAHSVEAALHGISLGSIADFVPVGWASQALPHHYTRLSRTMGSLASLLPQEALSSAEYADRMADDPHGFHRQAMPFALYEMVASESHFVDIFSSL